MALLAVMLALVWIASACGGSSTTSPSTVTSIGTSGSATAGAIPTSEPTAQAFIDQALLAVDDLPAGWQAASGAGASFDLTSNVCNGHIDEGGFLAHGQAALASGQESILERVAVYPTGRAPQILASSRAAFGACDQWTSTRSGQSLTYRASPLPFASFGDETVAFTVSAYRSANELVGTQVFVQVRRAATVMSLAYLTSGAPDTTRAENLVRAADDKLVNTPQGPSA